MPADALPAPLLDAGVYRQPLAGGDAYVVRPRDWEALREAEALDRRPVPWWARLWPSGAELARAVASEPPAAGARVLELGCGLALPSVAAARSGADVLATDGATDAVAYAAHNLALNAALAKVAHVDWTAHQAALVARGPFDLVLAADVLYTKANVEVALRLLPRLLARDGVVLLADPGRAGAGDLLAGVRGLFDVASEQRGGEVALHRLTRTRR